MKILYGVCGEGQGHATRSKVVIERLLLLGHQVLIAASDQALRVLGSDGTPGSVVVGPPPSTATSGGSLTGYRLLPIVGLGMRCANGALSLRGTLEENARRLPAMLTQNALTWAEVERSAPDATITDYEPFASLYASAHGLPLISIDNAQILPRCVHRLDVFGPYIDGMRALETYTRAMAPNAQHYIATTFFYLPVKPELSTSTTLVSPILRREVLEMLAAPRSEETYVLVYKTGSLDAASFLHTLAAVPEQRFVAYGLQDSATTPPNVQAKPYDVKGFLRDLVSCRAVISNGGMSLIGEALALGKPIYAVPVRGQFEQVMNACYLQRLGYGVTSEVLEPAVLRQFLVDLPHHARIIQSTSQHDANLTLYSTLDRLFGSAA